MVMVTRRAVLRGFGALCLTCCQYRRARAAYLFRNVLCATQSSAGLETGEFLKTSGNPDLDKALISEMTKQSAFFGYRPAFVLYSGGEKNAAATTEKLPQYPQTDGTILYNIDMLKEQLAISKWGGSILAGVIAHEFGHIYQFYSGYDERLKVLHSTVEFIELHADFLSGFYMGGKYGAIDIKDYADAFYKIGDYGFTRASHHGTPAERYLALKAGFNFRIRNNSESLASAAQEGEGFLKEYIHR